MSGHVGGLDSSLDLSALADALVMSTTPAIQDRINALPMNGVAHAQDYGSPTSSRTDDKLSTRKSQKAMDVRNLHRLYEEEGRQTEELRRVLKLTNDRLAAEREQAMQLDQRLKDVRLKEAAARMARKRAESEAAKAAAEARAYKLHFEMANFETTKAQQALSTLALERKEADAAAARARTTAHKLREKLVRERALHEGRREGMHDGIRVGYEEGVTAGWAEGRDEGYDEMRERAFAVWEQALKSGAINPNAEFDLDKAIRMERSKPPVFVTRGPSRRASVRESLNRYPATPGPNGHRHLRSKSTTASFRPQITSSDETISPVMSPRRVPVPAFAPERAPLISEVPVNGPTVTVTSPPGSSNLPQRTPSPQPFAYPASVHAPVAPLYEGDIPTLDENGFIKLPAPHDINPSPSSINAPLPNVSQSRPPTMGTRTPRSRKQSLSATDRLDEPARSPSRNSRNSGDRNASITDFRELEAAKLRDQLLEIQKEAFEREKRALEEEKQRMYAEFEQERAMHAADLKLREQQEEARERQRQLEKDAEAAREAERERERLTEIQREQQRLAELEKERARAAAQVAEAARLQQEVERSHEQLEAAARQREIERDAERKLKLEAEYKRLAAEEAAARQREIEREAAERIAAEREQQAREAAERVMQERMAAERVAQERRVQREQEAEAARKAELARFQADQVAALSEQDRERDLPRPPLSVRNNPGEDGDSDYDDDDPTTDDALPYEAGSRPQGRRTKRGSVHSAKTGRTGMSTPLSQFTVLEDVDNQAGKSTAQRKQEMARHRDSTLARERKRETAARSEAVSRGQPYMPVIPETSSQHELRRSSHSTSQNYNYGDQQPQYGDQQPHYGDQQQEEEKLVPRTPHSSLPALPVKLDKVYPPPMGPPSPRAVETNLPPRRSESRNANRVPGGWEEDMNSRVEDVERRLDSNSGAPPQGQSRMRRPVRPVVPVPAPAGGPIYGGPSAIPMNLQRNPYAQSVEQYDDLRSPSPTPSHRVGKPVSPIPTILVERPSDEGIQTTAQGSRGRGVTNGAATAQSQSRNAPRSILKNTYKSSANPYSSQEQSDPSPTSHNNQPIVQPGVIPNEDTWNTPVIPVPPVARPKASRTPSHPPPTPSTNIRMASKSPYYAAASTSNSETEVKVPVVPPSGTTKRSTPQQRDALPRDRDNTPQSRDDPYKRDTPHNRRHVPGSPDSSVKVPVTEDMLPTVTGPARMARPGYKIPPQKTDIEIFGAPGRPQGWGTGPPPRDIDETGGRTQPGSASRSPAGISTPHHNSNHVSPVNLNQSATPSFGFAVNGGAGTDPYAAAGAGFPFGNSNGGQLPTQTPRTRLARPIGSTPAAFEVEPAPASHHDPPPSARTPKTPYASMTPRMQRPVGAPTADVVDRSAPMSPANQAPVFTPATPRMQRPSGAPTGIPDFGTLPPEEIAVPPASQAKPPMRRPGMPAWESASKIEPFPTMAGPAVLSHPYSTPGRAQRNLPGQSMAATRSSPVQPVIGDFDDSTQHSRQGWGTNASSAAHLPSRSPAYASSTLPSANAWPGQQDSTSPTGPTAPSWPQAQAPTYGYDSNPGIVHQPVVPVVEEVVAPTKVVKEKKGKKGKLAKATGTTKPASPPPVIPIVPEVNIDPPSPPKTTWGSTAMGHSRTPSVPTFHITAPSPSVSPAPPDDSRVAPLVRPISQGAGSSSPMRRPIDATASKWASPASPAHSHRSVQPTVEEATDDDRPRKSPFPSIIPQLPPTNSTTIPGGWGTGGDSWGITSEEPASKPVAKTSGWGVNTDTPRSKARPASSGWGAAKSTPAKGTPAPVTNPLAYGDWGDDAGEAPPPVKNLSPAIGSRPLSGTWGANGTAKTKSPLARPISGAWGGGLGTGGGEDANVLPSIVKALSPAPVTQPLVSDDWAAGAEGAAPSKTPKVSVAQLGTPAPVTLPLVPAEDKDDDKGKKPEEEEDEWAINPKTKKSGAKADTKADTNTNAGGKTKKKKGKK